MIVSRDIIREELGYTKHGEKARLSGKQEEVVSKKFIEKPLKSDYKYSTKNKINIKKIILLIYLMIYKNHISLMHSSDKKDGTNFLCIKKFLTTFSGSEEAQ